VLGFAVAAMIGFMHYSAAGSPAQKSKHRDRLAPVPACFPARESQFTLLLTVESHG
jgi:hypothetical protein